MLHQHGTNPGGVERKVRLGLDIWQRDLSLAYRASSALRHHLGALSVRKNLLQLIDFNSSAKVDRCHNHWERFYR